MLRRRGLPDSIGMPSRLRRSWPATVIILAVAALAAYDRLPSRSSGRSRASSADLIADDLAHYQDREFAVARVIDGDTVDLATDDGERESTRVRLWGVDCPEPGHRATPGMHFGREALEFARRTLQGKAVHLLLSPKQTRDRHGRLLAYVFLERNGPMFNEMLIEQGYAYADRRFPHHYGARFESAERRAKNGKVGLWANLQPAEAPEWYRRMVLRGG